MPADLDKLDALLDVLDAASKIPRLFGTRETMRTDNGAWVEHTGPSHRDRESCDACHALHDLHAALAAYDAATPAPEAES
jgi:hypothetical protein